MSSHLLFVCASLLFSCTMPSRKMHQRSMTDREERQMMELYIIRYHKKEISQNCSCAVTTQFKWSLDCCVCVFIDSVPFYILNTFQEVEQHYIKSLINYFLSRHCGQSIEDWVLNRNTLFSFVEKGNHYTIYYFSKVSGIFCFSTRVF